MCPSEFNSDALNLALQQAADGAWEKALSQPGFNDASLWTAMEAKLDDDALLQANQLPAELAHLFLDEAFLSTYADDPAFLPDDTCRDFERWLPAMPDAQTTIQEFVALNHTLRQYFIRHEEQCTIAVDAASIVNQALQSSVMEHRHATPVRDVLPFPRWMMATAAAISLIVVVGSQKLQLINPQASYLSTIPSPESYVLDQCDDVLPIETDPSWIIYNCTLGI